MKVYSSSMRFTILTLVSLLLAGCGSFASTSGQMKVDSGILQATGVIVAREIFDLKGVINTTPDTGAASVDNKSFGLEYLAASDNGYKSNTAIRYDIKLLEGSLLTIYSEAWRYQVDDCVNVMIDLEDKKTPPLITLNKNDC